MRAVVVAVVSILALSPLLVGCGVPSFLITPVSNTNTLREVEVREGSGWSQPKIVILEVEGMLMNARSGGFLQPTENPLSRFTQQLRAAEKDERVKAVVLRINSPGGTVTCTDTMYTMVKDFRERTKKPVIASTQEIAASGGYYVACASDQIVAHPTSVVGSIGVIFETFDISRGLDKLGIKNEAIKSGELKDMGSPFKPLAPEARNVMQGMIDQYHGRFVSVVQANRPITESEKLRLVTDGRVFSGEQAHALGLVDRLGTLEDAIELAKELSKSPNAGVVMYKRPYGYGGSIYASTATPPPQANVLQLPLPETDWFLPRGFYYLWKP
jgi:protease-4